MYLNAVFKHQKFYMCDTEDYGIQYIAILIQDIHQYNLNFARQIYNLQQSGTTHIFINAIHGPYRPCSAPCWFDRVSIKPICESRLGHL